MKVELFRVPLHNFFFKESEKLDCKTAVFFANTFERSSKARSGANFKARRFAPSIRDC